MTSKAKNKRELGFAKTTFGYGFVSCKNMKYWCFIKFVIPTMACSCCFSGCHRLHGLFIILFIQQVQYIQQHIVHKNLLGYFGITATYCPHKGQLVILGIRQHAVPTKARWLFWSFRNILSPQRLAGYFGHLETCCPNKGYLVILVIQQLVVPTKASWLL